ncbi:hypothetical protein BABINDRAFT_40462 [Babjeviella inositovora NRRL Y-12698]|uniref:Band 7 domain-containing protein n=1 Tax=Babjeviella inositovora NRRL Y-12698 TaxID=984486 RepID=A0A1E3QJT2_9ASCO|nr:uncharacterized protein BABINDRAFT_40462 [Babjeviella inositovora NRRL Y-12698]ODQ77939.1 hypothetical protein BABINDRAFT_40462 [Babjeviella inositovora NRRL Y-12698]
MKVQSFAFELAVPGYDGWYPHAVDCFGNCFGTLGTIPCCICCPNPYKSVLQGNVGLITKFGKLYKAVDPGLVKVNILSEKLKSVSVMLTTAEVSQQNCMTKDNVNVYLTSVIYYQVIQPEVATFAVQDVRSALVERTHTTLRDVIGSRQLQDVIERREEIAEAISEIIGETVAAWGIHVESILIKDLALDSTVSKSLSMAAEAKRIGESKIITAKAEVESAKLMRKAADILASKAAMQIRYLDAMQQMAKTANSKVIFTPTQESFDNMTEKFENEYNQGQITNQPEGSSAGHLKKQNSGRDAFSTKDMLTNIAVQESYNSDIV